MPFPALVMFGMIAFWAVTIVVHVFFAVAVYRDAQSLPDGRSPILVGPAIWLAATLAGGVIVAGIYWAMHYSRLNAAVPTGHAEKVGGEGI
jgi:hypothetical protein